MPDTFRDTPTPSYNMLDEEGISPAFWTYSSKIMEMMLQFDDLEVVRRKTGETLLWRCAYMGIMTENIAMDERLRGQVAEVYGGTLPLEKGEPMIDGFITRAFQEIQPDPTAPRSALAIWGNHWWPPVQHV